MRNEKQCIDTFSNIEGEIHRCSLFDGHPENHISIYEWTEEEAEYPDDKK